MLLIALILAAVLILVLQEKYYDRHAMDDLDYTATLNTSEVFEDEDVYLYENLTNRKSLPLPSLRAESELPEGLFFRVRGGGKEEKLVPTVQSVFVLHGQEQIKRRWRVHCKKRGVYRVGSVLLVAADLLGASTDSKRIRETEGKAGVLTVLPRPIDLDSFFVSSAYLSGEQVANRALLSDPLLIAGTRDYSPLDPMNRVNWKSTAAHGRLMVNVEEFTRTQRFTLLLNMQSRPIELHKTEPSDKGAIELGISVCATILDRLSAKETPVRMLINTESALLSELGAETVTLGEGDKTILQTPEYCGKQAMIDALRVLAAIPMRISAPAEAVWDDLATRAAQVADGGNIVIVSAYLDERMLVLHDTLTRMGYRAVFYITALGQNTVIPDDIEVYFRTWDGGASA